MPYRNVTITAISLFFSGVILWAFTYGPANRTFVTPDRTVTVRSAGEIDSLWRSSGVHGRIAVIFTRHLHQQLSGTAFPEMDYIDRAMRHGVVRAVYYVVPDRAWPEVVSENILQRPKKADTGFILLHDCGRIHVMPLSKYIPEHDKEKALVVIEAGTWSQQEQFRIDNYLQSGLLTADLVVRIGNALLLN